MASSSQSEIATPSPSPLILCLTRTNDTLSKLQTILSQTSGLDAFLLSAQYPALALSALLPRLASPGNRLSTRAPRLAHSLVELGHSSRALYGLINLWRMFARLVALLGVYLSFLKLLTAVRAQMNLPPMPVGAENVKRSHDGLKLAVTAAKLSTGFGFQLLENIALLSQYGVIRNISPTTRARLWVLSARFWMLFVGAEFVRLGSEVWERTVAERSTRALREVGERVEVERRVATGGVGEEKVPVAEGSGGSGQEGSVVLVEGVQEEEKALARAEELQTKPAVTESDTSMGAQWWDELYVNAANAPLSLHYSAANGAGPLGDSMIAALGAVTGVIGFRQAWKKV